MKQRYSFIKYLTITLLLCLAILPAKAEAKPDSADQDSLRAYLVTCSPGDKIYSYYGHTAIRIKDTKNFYDLAFNYGVFSFEAPNFVWRFVRGETDYELGIIPYSLFLKEYDQRGSYVIEQELNLNPEEKATLLKILIENFQPANRIYRYNFLYTNCTTKARDVIESAVGGKVVYNSRKETSYRNIIHEYTENYPWSEFGQDCLLGAEADKPISRKAQEFAPFVLKEDFATAKIKGTDGNIRMLVKKEMQINPLQAKTDTDSLMPSPLGFMCILLCAAILIRNIERSKGKYFWQIDAILFGIQGIIGCIVATLFFFSEHPTVGSNWLIILFNPLPLLYLPRLFYLAKKGRKDAFYPVAGVIIIIFLIFSWAIPQKFPTAIVPLALILLLRILTKLAMENKKRKNILLNSLNQ